jgi:4-oxalocrotonate tautomerase
MLALPPNPTPRRRIDSVRDNAGFTSRCSNIDGAEGRRTREASKERAMPHIIVKLYAGRSEQQKSRLAEEISKAVMTVLRLDAESISVAIEDVTPKDWSDKVYKPDILGSHGKLYKKPGYSQPT